MGNIGQWSLGVREGHAYPELRGNTLLRIHSHSIWRGGLAASLLLVLGVACGGCGTFPADPYVDGRGLATSAILGEFGAGLSGGIIDAVEQSFTVRGVNYSPIPIGGALTSLLVIERFLTRKFFAEPDPETVSQLQSE